MGKKRRNTDNGSVSGRILKKSEPSSRYVDYSIARQHTGTEPSDSRSGESTNSVNRAAQMSDVLYISSI
jgi:hypothetical protein